VCGCESAAATVAARALKGAADGVQPPTSGARELHEVLHHLIRYAGPVLEVGAQQAGAEGRVQAVAGRHVARLDGRLCSCAGRFGRTL
jgi:hypothetical protein